MIKKLMPTLSLITLVLMVTMLVFAVYWLFLEPVALVIKDPLNVQLDKKVYHPGDTITYTFDYCKTKPTIATVGRKLVDGIEINFAVKQVQLPAGCHTLVRNDLRIPKSIDKGVYHLEGSSIQNTNPLREDVVQWKSVEFNIE